MKSAIVKHSTGKSMKQFEQNLMNITNKYEDPIEEDKFEDLMEVKRKDSSQISMKSAASSVGPTMSDLCKCYVMNKSHHIKSRLVYIDNMQLYVTYLSEDGESLVVALNVDLKNSHAMTDAPRAIKMTKDEIAAMEIPAEVS